MKKMTKIFLVLTFVLVLFSVHGYLYSGKLQVEEKLARLDHPTEPVTVTVERYYKGVPEKNVYTLSKNDLETWKNRMKDINYSVPYQKTFTIQNDYSYHFRVMEDGMFLLDLTISDNYVELFDASSSAVLNVENLSFYDEISTLVNDWMGD